MNLSFDSKLAEKFGLAEAVFIYHLQYIMKDNQAEARHYVNGKYWVEKSYAGFCNFFKFMNQKQIRYIIQKLEEKKVIISYSKENNAKMYTFSDPMLEYLGNPMRQEAPETDAEFERFWNMYDKKVGKQKCERLWNKLSGKAKEMCMERLPDYIKATPDKQFRKNPETFLRNKAWKDEIIAKRGATRNDRKPTTKYQYKNEA